MTDEQIINILNFIPLENGNYIPSKNKYESYDAENFTSIVEIKKRSSYYDLSLIEKLKYTQNINTAYNTGRTFYYVVFSDPRLTIWDITWLVRVNYKYGWENSLQVATTEFKNNIKINKNVGYLNVTRSIFNADISNLI